MKYICWDCMQALSDRLKLREGAMWVFGDECYVCGEGKAKVVDMKMVQKKLPSES